MSSKVENGNGASDRAVLVFCEESSPGEIRTGGDPYGLFDTMQKTQISPVRAFGATVEMTPPLGLVAFEGSVAGKDT
ncbi:MAG: hypothetical protein ACP5M4_05255 [Acidobacteriaceae bacterium]